VDLSGATLAGRYRVVRLLGSGGMGQVYDAEDASLGRHVAIKTLHPHLLDHPRAVERFRREAQAIAALSHAHVVRVLDFQSNPGEPTFFVMEHLEGRSLRDEIRAAGRLPADRVVPIAKQVLSALGAAHAAGIVHRDVKPDNIMLVSVGDAADFVKLVDFGVARNLDDALSRLTATGALIGTVEYMPPEQAEGAVVDARADLYAVGACMYHALSGRPPFMGDSTADKLNAICTQPLVPLDALCPDLDLAIVKAIERAMSKDPSARYASAEEMTAALTALAPGSVLGRAERERGRLPEPPRAERAAQKAKAEAHDALATVAEGALVRTTGARKRRAETLEITAKRKRRRSTWQIWVAAFGFMLGVPSLLLVLLLAFHSNGHSGPPIGAPPPATAVSEAGVVATATPSALVVTRSIDAASPAPSVRHAPATAIPANDRPPPSALPSASSGAGPSPEDAGLRAGGRPAYILELYGCDYPEVLVRGNLLNRLPTVDRCMGPLIGDVRVILIADADNFVGQVLTETEGPLRHCLASALFGVPLGSSATGRPSRCGVRFSTR
jgi:serine/threonine-protein kinase